MAQDAPTRLELFATSASPTAPLSLVLTLYVLALVTFATVTNGWGPLHHDMTEAWAWGKEFQLGYAKPAALITQGAPGHTCRPLMSPRRSIRSAVMLQTPIIFAAASRVISPRSAHSPSRWPAITW